VSTIRSIVIGVAGRDDRVLAIADEVRREGERVIARLEARRPPFCDGWESWQPDPGWPIPELPAEWEGVAR